MTTASEDLSAGMFAKPSSSAGDDSDSLTRNAYARYATAANAAAIVIQGIVSMLAVRWTLFYLGDERFGLWMTVLGIGGVLTFADLGVGNALVSRVAAARASAAGVLPPVAVTGGIAVVAVLGTFIGVCGACICAVLPWERILAGRATPDLCAEFRSSSVLFAALFGLSVISMGVRKIYEGLQRGYVSHVVACIAACLSLASIYLTSHRFMGIPWLLLATYGVTVIVPLALVVPLAMRHLLRPSRLVIDGTSELRNLLHVGSQYTLVQLGSLLLTGSEALLVSAIQGASALTGLSLVQRLFQFATVPGRILNTPYWGAYADAHARGHRGYVRRTLIRQLQVTGVLTAALACAVAVSSVWLIPLWTNGAKTADTSLVIASCCLCVLEGILMPFGVYLNGTGCVRPQAVATVFAIFTYFPAKIAALAFGGVSAMIWTTIAFQILNSVLFYAFVYRDQVWDAVRQP